MYAICKLSIIPLRADKSDKSEIVSQILFGEHFTIIEQDRNWTMVQTSNDSYIGWIDTKQYTEIGEKPFNQLKNIPKKLSGDLIEFVYNNNELINIPLGSDVTFLSIPEINTTALNFEGTIVKGDKIKSKLVETALMYLNAPYLWGGRTPFGIDCSGLTQIVYALNGIEIPRDAKDQAIIGEPLSFIEECESGDLAFFDNEEGVITHVGIVMPNNQIIHAHGCVRVDKLDHLGILNTDTGAHSHKLRILKKII